MHDALLIARAFRDIWKAIDDNGRRLAAMHMTGKVAEIDGNRVRLELLPQDGRTGRPFLSPWVQLQDSAGSTATHTPVAVGDPMRLISPSGELGEASLAIRDSHIEDRPNPASDPDELVIEHAGCEIRMRERGLLLKRGSTVIELLEDGIRVVGEDVDITGRRLAHNDLDVGSTHRHRDTEPGPGTSGIPTPAGASSL